MTACVRFPWRAVVTTAFDDLWEQALDAADGGRRPPAVMTAARRSGAGAIVRTTAAAHRRDASSLPESLCLGPGDARVRLVPSPAMGWLAHMARRRSLVFVGFRPTDPDLVWLSSWLSTRPSRGSALPISGRLVGSGCRHRGGGLGAAHRLRGDPLSGGDRRGRRTPGDDRDVDRRAAAAAGYGHRHRYLAGQVGPGPRQPAAARGAGPGRNGAARRRALGPPDRALAAAPGSPGGRGRAAGGAARRGAHLPRQAGRAGARADARHRDAAAAARTTTSCGRACARTRRRRAPGSSWSTHASDIAQAAGPTPEAARIWRELARVLRENLARPDDALAAYREALQADPADRETRDAEAELLRELGRWQELASVLHAAASESDDPGARDRAHAGGSGAVRGAAGRRGRARSRRTSRCWPSTPTRRAASRRGRSRRCTSSTRAGPTWRACWSGGRCSRRRPRRSRCGGAAPSCWRRS